MTSVPVGDRLPTPTSPCGTSGSCRGGDSLLPMPVARRPPSAVTIERVLDQPPVTIRSVVVAVGQGRVRILEYYRRRPDETRFVRVHGAEGRVVPFEQLRLERSFAELFPQGELFER